MGSLFDPYDIMIFIQLDIKLDWRGLAYGLVYPIPAVARGQVPQDKIGKTMNNIMRTVLRKGLSWLIKNLTGILREVGKFQIWGIVVSLLKMDQDQNQIDPRKAVHILKILFQYFYYLVFRIHRFLRCMMFYTEEFFCNEDLLQYILQHLLLEQFEYILYPVFF